MKIEEIPVIKALGIKLLGAHQRVYEATGGRLGHRLLVVPCLLLRTVGAKTGMQRSSCLTYARDGSALLVVASNGGDRKAPGWYHNLRADPAAEIQIGTHRQQVTARFALPGDADYDRLWSIVNKNNSNRYNGYQKLTDRPIPVVVLSPV
ncbi:MAG TPA: nitroreductase family deazaflavin-dependent oxidoreductase [Jatrophihabitantaceae bacterium]|nr:nitroreductase family deazaflavin-dependent oxidoreductase [Jatrophihabitantaceae bacterium]